MCSPDIVDRDNKIAVFRSQLMLLRKLQIAENSDEKNCYLVTPIFRVESNETIVSLHYARALNGCIFM